MSGTSVTFFDLYDCQSIIQLAAGINLALTVGAALREPYAATFDTAADKAFRQIAWSKRLLTAPRQTPADQNKIQAATAIAQSGEDAVRLCLSDFKDAAAGWRRWDTRNFGLAVFVSLVSIIFLFKAAGPHKTIDVDITHLHSVILEKHAIYRTTMLFCSFLYFPLITSIISFLHSTIKTRKAIVEMRSEVAEVQDSVRSALL